MNSFVRRAAMGMLCGVLLFAALNSLSYFVRTGGNLQPHGGEIGFPWLVWAANGRSGGQFHPYGLLANIWFGLIASAASGCVIATVIRGERRIWQSKLADLRRPQESADESSVAGCGPRQFSLRGVLLLTASVAVLCALGREADPGSKRLLLIPLYWSGPSLLVATYCLTARLAPRDRARSVLFVAALVILATVITGASAGLNDMTLVALGFYVYWTPQCVLLLGSIGAWALMHRQA